MLFHIVSIRHAGIGDLKWEIGRGVCGGVVDALELVIDVPAVGAGVEGVVAAEGDEEMIVAHFELYS